MIVGIYVRALPKLLKYNMNYHQVVSGGPTNHFHGKLGSCWVPAEWAEWPRYFRGMRTRDFDGSEFPYAIGEQFAVVREQSRSSQRVSGGRSEHR
jgi:hypothetical protein